jgi:hypothetical protein
MAAPMARFWLVPEGLRVAKDGSWWVGELPVQHAASLFHLKRHLIFADDGAYVAEGGRRIPVVVEGPPFFVQSLLLDPLAGAATAVLDDGTTEAIGDTSLSVDEETGRIECQVRGGRARAALSRAAHQTILDHVEEEEGRFYLRVGPRRLRLAS